MFLIMGISNGEKKLDFSQTIICETCGQYGHLEVFMTFTYFSLFFIPILKWKKRFYVKSLCCNRIYSIPEELGKQILHGQQVTLRLEDLHAEGYASSFHNHCQAVQCSNCGYEADTSFVYCPKCGNKL